MQDELLEPVVGHRAPSVVFVTHDLEEAIALADRVVVMTAGPATVKDVFDDRPAAAREGRGDPADARFIEIYREIWDSLREEVEITRARGASRVA